jgi:hypothetical protein
MYCKVLPISLSLTMNDRLNIAVRPCEQWHDGGLAILSIAACRDSALSAMSRSMCISEAD